MSNLFDAYVSPTQAYTLRPYQRQGVAAGIDYIRGNMRGNAVIVAPTGSGKSLYLASMVDELDEPVLVLQPSQEILMQNYEKLCHYGYYPAVFSAALNRKNVSNITLATIGSVVNRLGEFNRFRTILIDECHRVKSIGGQYMKLFRHLEQHHARLRVLGLTATPFRLYSSRFVGAENRFITRTLPKVFHNMVHCTQLQELYEGGFLVPNRYKIVPGFTRKGITKNSSGSDFSDASLARRFAEIGFDQMTARTVMKLGEQDKHILVFNKFVKNAQYIRDELGNVHGAPSCAMVCDETPAGERNEMTQAFRMGQVQVMTNVGIYTTGFDFPALDCVVLARPTFSLSLYYQMVGRGARPFPGKDSCKLVDMCENVAVFGPIENFRIEAEPGHVHQDLWAVYSGKYQLTNVSVDQIGMY